MCDDFSLKQKQTKSVANRFLFFVVTVQWASLAHYALSLAFFFFVLFILNYYSSLRTEEHARTGIILYCIVEVDSALW